MRVAKVFLLIFLSQASALPTACDDPDELCYEGSCPQIETEELPPATVGVRYEFQIESNGEGNHWTVEDGELPPGLRLGHRTGVISGTPTVAGESPMKVCYQLTQSDGASDRLMAYDCEQYTFVCRTPAVQASVGTP